MRSYWIIRKTDNEIIGNYKGVDGRDALVNWIRCEGLDGHGTITQSAEARRYVATVEGVEYIATNGAETYEDGTNVAGYAVLSQAIPATEQSPTGEEYAAVVEWCRGWYEDCEWVAVSDEAGDYTSHPTDAELLRGVNIHVDGGLAFVLADVRRCEMDRRIGRCPHGALLGFCTHEDCAAPDHTAPDHTTGPLAELHKAVARGVAESGAIVEIPAPYKVAVVFDMESDDAPMPLGVLVNGIGEDVVNYLGSDGETHYAPYDCVRVVNVEIPR